jgi:cellulose synthase/poly-beta-1,6-N-acetylglucosamine synthase-like glycosyltransferase
LPDDRHWSGTIMSTPQVSVVIPSRRRARLAFALEALAAQTMACEHFEVIVVREPSAAPPPPAPEGLHARVLTASSDSNIALLRNDGWRAAAAPLIAFTDDDCRPAPPWLERLVAAADGSGVIVQGRTEPDPDELHLLHGLARSQSIVGPSDWYQTCNILYRRELLEGLGGFDDSFGQLGEDTDLALRARAGGATIRYVDEALVRHAVIPRSLPTALRQARRRDTIPRLIARHPEQRRALYGGLFWQRSHAFLLLGVVGAAGARRHPALALAAAPYLKRVLDAGEARSARAYLRRLLHLPSRLIVDVLETAVTIRAAARERVPVL